MCFSRLNIQCPLDNAVEVVLGGVGFIEGDGGVFRLYVLSLYGLGDFQDNVSFASVGDGYFPFYIEFREVIGGLIEGDLLAFLGEEFFFHIGFELHGFVDLHAGFGS